MWFGARLLGRLVSVVMVSACASNPITLDEEGSSGTGGSTGPVGVDTMVDPPAPGTTAMGTVPGGDVSSGSGDDATADSGGPDCEDCRGKVDLLIVVDNSGTMGEEQAILARTFPQLISRLENLTDSTGAPVEADVHIMVTTSDFGNPLCTPFQPEGYEPSQGQPISSPCTVRLDDFDNLSGTLSLPEVCEDVCPWNAQPSAPFIAFDGNSNNVGDVPESDIDGDGIPDSPVAQALACIGPQGINGCGYEAPLENMLQALNPGAAWNSGATPFLRPDALLALVIVTDEADCSVADFAVMDNPEFQEVNPQTGMQTWSSAICWNAGVDCGPPVDGVFPDCTSTSDDGLQPVSRYTSFIDDLRDNQGKEVVMLGILGVPVVTEHNVNAPFEPTAGGVADLVYRQWIDGQYPVGDILPDEFGNGITAAYKQWEFGIGPGCTGQDGQGGFTGQAIPPLRVREVCDSLDSDGGVHCCLESICDSDFAPAIDCLAGMISQTIEPE